MTGQKWIAVLALAAALALPATCVQAADIGLTKDVNPHDPNIYHPGDTIFYVMTVTNLAVAETIRVDFVEDELPDGTLVTLDDTFDAAYPPFPYFLAPGESQNYAITWDVPMDESGNVVNVLRCQGVQLSTVPDAFSAQVQKTSLIITPCIEVTKEVDCGISKAGDQVMYHICVTNCGNTDLFQVTVMDDVIGNISDDFPGGLAPGEMACADFAYTVEVDDPDPLINTVTATAEDEAGFAVSDSDFAEVDLIHPCLEASMECMTDPVSPGGTADFMVTATNCGDCTLIVDGMERTAGETWQWTESVPDPGGVDEVCHEITLVWELPVEYCDMDNTGMADASACCPIEGGDHGCTPGFWKTHPDCWCEDYETGDMLGSIFTVPSELSGMADDSLMKALKYGGGPGVEGAASNLFRSAVSALLNACNDNVNYPMSVSSVISEVNTALATLDRHEILSLHAMLDMYNNLGCSIDAHCIPIMEEYDSMMTP
jgi:uncharacterized repeat protein (TIGR01451 family)